MEDVDLRRFSEILEMPGEAELKNQEVQDTTRSIHSEASIAYYRDELDADQWVLDVLQNKYRIPFKETPPPYCEPNNQSAVRHKTVLWKKMKEWEKAGFCMKVEGRPYSCNPMSVAAKTDLKTGEVKLRPCMDLSRNINLFVPDLPVKISHLAVAEQLLETGDYQTCFDLKNMYMHLQIHEDFFHRTVLCLTAL
jgi:hypothetical protein